MAAEHRAWIALGANLGDIRANLRGALAALAALPGSRLAAVSPWYRSRAVGPHGQPDYINGVAELRTTLDPHALLAELQRIEAAAGRERSQRWAARTLDLDLLLYGNQHFTHERLVIPHPGVRERRFVLQPLADISPDLVLPDGSVVRDLLARCAPSPIFNDGTLRLPH